MLLLNKQVAHELTNYQIYMKIYNILSVAGYTNMASYFKKQGVDESGHQQIVLDYCTDRNEIVSFEQINTPEVPMQVTAIADLYLATEISTTNALKDLYRLCLAKMDFLSAEKIRQMLTEQIEEEASALDFRDKVKNIGETPAMLQIFDNTFEA